MRARFSPLPLVIKLSLVTLSLLTLLLSSRTSFADGGPLFDAPRYLDENYQGSAAALVTGDLNGDGAVDVVLAGTQSRIYLNDSQGNFTAADTPLASATSVALGDLNSDGSPDILLGRLNAASQVYLSDTQGGFAAPISLNPAGNPTRSVALGDLNGDGNLDALLGNDGQPSQVYLNGGNAVFTQTLSLNAAGTSTQSVALGDLNGDGFLDVLLGNGDQPSQVYQSDGQGSFRPPVPINASGANTQSVALGDLDGDGFLDVLLGNRFHPSQILVNDRQGGLIEAPYVLNDNNAASDVALGDFDGDSDLDIIFGNYSVPFISQPQQSQIFVNDGRGVFTAPANLFNSGIHMTTSVALADINGDGSLDIMLGNDRKPGLIYQNSGHVSFTAIAALNASAMRIITLGDLDGNHTLDAILFLDPIPSYKVYRNNGRGNFTELPTQLYNHNTRSMALGDLDNNGSLDILFGNDGQSSQALLNDGTGVFTPSIQLNPGGSNTQSVALGDLDGNGTLDVLLGNSGEPSQVLLNTGTGVFTPSIPLNPGGSNTQSVALGDLDGDGTLDVILGNSGEPSQALLNDGAGVFTPPIPLNPSGSNTRSVALGDLNGDGTLDVLLGNYQQPSRAYLNDGLGGFTAAAVPINPAGASTQAVALGDFNGDGALDILLGNDPETREYGEASQIYLNNGQGHFTSSAPMLLNPTQNPVQSLALGDLNGDGALDILLGNASYYRTASQIYLNQLTAGARLPNNPPTVVVARPGSTPATNFYSTPQIFASPVIAIPFTLADDEGDPVAISVAFSLDGGGNWRTAEPDTSTNSTYATIPGRFLHYPATPIIIPDLTSVTASLRVDAPESGLVGAITDIDVELTLRHSWDSDLQAALKAPDGTIVPLFEAVGDDGDNFTSTILDDEATTPIAAGSAPFTGSFLPMGRLAAFDGKSPVGQWSLIMTDTTTSDVGSVVSWALRIKTTGVQHTFHWNTFKSDLFGQSDNVVVRIVAAPAPGGRHTASGPYQRPYASATTFPFRVRGTQVRVVSPQGEPMPGAVAFRLNEMLASEQQLFARTTDAPAFTTDHNGYLRGRGELAPGDQLIALAPIPLPGPYAAVYSPTVRLYATNIITAPAGLSGFTVQRPGVQTVTVAPERPLALFDLIVSLEWDARYDARFMAQLQGDLARASELLFQASHGQAALGTIIIFHDKENWDQADIRIYASNRVRPSALIGGVAYLPLNDPAAPSVFYGPGQVHMGAVWNRFGSSGGNLGEDWPRTLVHELGHYLLFLQDNYLGLDAGQVVPVDSCPGLMSDPYAATWQFQTGAGWRPGCELTFSNQATGRADWQTITTLFPALHAPAQALGTLPAGPIRLPLALTEIRAVDPLTPTARLDVPIFYTVDEAGGRAIPALTARAYLFQHGHGDPSADYTQLTALGRANSDQVLARGARAGDRLCLFEPAAARFGCETIRAGREQLTLHTRSDWQPDIQITPVTSTTLEVMVTGLPAGAGPLTATLYPLDDDPRPAPATISAGGGGVYRGSFTLAYPLAGAYIHLRSGDRAPNGEPRWETVTSYAMDGNAGGYSRTGSGAGYSRTGSGATFARTGGAPVSSAEGDVQLVGADLTFAEGQFLLLQTTSSLPAPPAWATPISQGYRFSASTGWLTATAALSGTALSFSYLDSEVPAGEEAGIQVYYRSPTATAWAPITTTLDTYFNLASVPTQGPGLYALMSSVHVPLPAAGWNLFAYPVAGSREVGLALSSISSHYNIVYSHVPTDTLNPWKAYAPAPAPSWASDLKRLEFGRGYWIYATRASDLLLKGSADSAAASTLSLPPALVYGVLSTVAGEPVEARIGTAICGSGITRAVGGQVGFAVKVAASGPDSPACGLPGSTITITVAGNEVGHVAWDNTRAVQLRDWALGPGVLYLPLVRR